MCNFIMMSQHITDEEKIAQLEALRSALIDVMRFCRFGSVGYEEYYKALETTNEKLEYYKWISAKQ